MRHLWSEGGPGIVCCYQNSGMVSINKFSIFLWKKNEKKTASGWKFCQLLNLANKISKLIGH